MTPEDEVDSKYEHAERIGTMIGRLEYPDPTLNSVDKLTIREYLSACWSEWSRLEEGVRNRGIVPQLEAFLQMARHRTLEQLIERHGPMAKTLEEDSVLPTFQIRDFGLEGNDFERLQLVSRAFTNHVAELVLKKLEEQQNGREDIRIMADEVGREVARTLGLPRNV